MVKMHGGGMLEISGRRAAAQRDEQSGDQEQLSGRKNLVIG
jgi:hypothetical protein